MKQAFSSKPPRHLLRSELKLWLIAASPALPFLALVWLWRHDTGSGATMPTLMAAAGVAWIAGAAFWARRVFVHQLRTLNTLVEAIRREDYSLRGAHTREGGELAELVRQINALADQLQHSRREETELRGLLERIVAQINVAVLACDHNGDIVLANPPAARLLGLELEALRGLPLIRTEVAPLLPEGESHLREHAFAGAAGRWQISRQAFVQEGRQGTLIFITDLEQVLSEEEIRAWQRLIRVIAHEVNNSLTPITSLCQTLDAILARGGGADQHERLAEGLRLIRERAVNLGTFISDYARIARLPEADKRPFDPLALLHRVRAMHPHYHLLLRAPERPLSVYGDSTQIEQVLINLIKNASEANGDPALPIEISLATRGEQCEVIIRDQGPGILNKANLFVPFYTTKDQGAGIGLALSRRIVAAHHGSLTLDNRADGKGVQVRLSLPLSTV